MSVREHKDKDTTEIINKKAFITDKAIQEVRKTAQKPTEDPAIFAKANASVHNLKTTEQKEQCNNDCNKINSFTHCKSPFRYS